MSISCEPLLNEEVITAVEQVLRNAAVTTANEDPILPAIEYLVAGWLAILTS